VWVVPPAVLFLLFTIRSADPSTALGAGRGGEGLLSWRDAETHGPWNSMFLVGGAVAMTDALTRFGFADAVGRLVTSTGIGPLLLPYMAAAAAGISTNFISGTALLASIFVPAAQQIGFNPASMAILLGHLGVGLIFPWAGATSATTFTAGDVSMGRMIGVGLAATAVFIVLVATIHVLMAGLV
jgi:di/tricarboxylate transporter